MNCPRCEYDNPADTNYCGKCGMPLTLDGETAAYDPESIKTLFRDVKTGTTFSDRYEVIDELGKGGMGAVYKVYDKKIKEKIALKLIRPEIALNEKTAERFRNEIKLARRITHRNVCRMYDLGEDGPSLFITMEYISGQDLRRMLQMTSHFSVGTAVNIAKQVCQGLVESHRLGVVHRDLKPQNIMIDTEGSVKIMDFGIAHSLHTTGMTATGVLIGTPEYMSPEQAEGKGVDERTDIYSLGVILFEMVTKKVPFSGETPLSVALKHKTEAPEHPAAFNTAVSSDLDRIIMKCLEKDKDKRYAGAAELLADLSRVEEGIPTIEKIIPVPKPRTSSEITVTLQPRKYILPVLAGLLLVSLAWVMWKLVIAPKPSFDVESAVTKTSLPKPKEMDKVLTPPQEVGESLARFSRLNDRNSGRQKPSFDEILTGILVKGDKGFSEFEKVQSVLQLLAYNPLRRSEELSPENIENFIKSLDQLKTVLLKDGPYKETWEKIIKELEKSRELVEQGKFEEAKLSFKTAYHSSRGILTGLTEKIAGDRSKNIIQVYARTGETEAKVRDKKETGQPLSLRSLAMQTAESGDRFYEMEDFTQANILYSLAEDIFAMAGRCQDEQACIEELSRYVDRKRSDADRFQAQQHAAPEYSAALNWQIKGTVQSGKKNYADAGDFYIRAATAFEKSKQSAIDQQQDKN